MNRKLARLEALLANGWHVEDMTSDWGTIDVMLRRRAAETTVVLDRDDAAEVLYGETWFHATGPRATLVVER